MTIAWLDVIKLTVPFVTAVLMVWIKAWIEIYLATSSKQHALSRGCPRFCVFQFS